MSVETVTYISDLDYTQPLTTDQRKQGDDHLRNIKLALRQTFPNINAPVTATAAQLNALSARYASVVEYGATAGGVIDCTTYFQAAIDSGLPVYIPAGSYLITDSLDCPTEGQIIFGDGRQRSIVVVANGFDLTANGVFVASSGEEGPQFRDFKISFTQPDTAVRASLIAFPPALYMRATPRFTVANMAITNAMTGIDMQGNSGGAFIDQLELSAYNIGIDIDGSLDSVRCSRLHFWNFDMTTNQQVIFNDSTTIGIKCARADDLHISDSLFIGTSGKAIRFYTSASGSAFGNIVNTDFDNYGGLNVESGKISISSCFFSMGATSAQAIIQTGGDVRVSACKFESSVALTNPMVSCSGSANAYMTVGNSMFANTGDMKCLYVAASSGNNTLIATGNQFIAPQNASPAKALVHAASGGRLTFIGNRASDKGTGSGNLVQLDADDHHVVTDNAFVGWSISNVAPQVLAIINNNTSVDGWVSYTPTITASSGTFTTVSATGLYKQYGKTMHIRIAITITTNGTAASSVRATMPSAASGVSGFTFIGRAAAVSGKSVVGYLADTSSTMNIVNYDNSYPGATGELIVISGTYQTA